MASVHVHRPCTTYLANSISQLCRIRHAALPIAVRLGFTRSAPVQASSAPVSTYNYRGCRGTSGAQQGAGSPGAAGFLSQVSQCRRGLHSAISSHSSTVDARTEPSPPSSHQYGTQQQALSPVAELAARCAAVVVVTSLISTLSSWFVSRTQASQQGTSSSSSAGNIRPALALSSAPVQVQALQSPAIPTPVCWGCFFPLTDG
jgi:hypothetical protein